MLKIKVAKELEGAFTTEEKKRSGVYKNEAGKGLQFYAMTPSLSGFITTYRRNVSCPSIEGLDNYGVYMVNESGYYNFSIIRTVGISEGITVRIDKIILNRDVETWISEFAKFLKFTYENLVGEKEISAVITIEL